MIVIGLTGGIATGKSTVSDMFKKQQIPVIDADLHAKHVCEIGEAAYVKIVETFGEEVLLVTGHLNRKKLASLVFNNKEKREQLNKIVHPEVKKLIENEIKRYKLLDIEYVVIDVPLLFESGFDKLCDLTVVVFTSQEKQLERLMNRDNLTKEEALKRINAQMSMGDKIKLADYIIDNSLSILETRKQFDSFIKKLQENN